MLRAEQALGPLLDVERWDDVPEAAQEVAIAEVARRLGEAFERRQGSRRFGVFRERASGIELRLVPGRLDVAPFLIAPAPDASGATAGAGALGAATGADLEYAVRHDAVSGEKTRRGETFRAAAVPGLAALQEAAWAEAGRALVVPEAVRDELRDVEAIATTGWGTALVPMGLEWMHFASERALITGWNVLRTGDFRSWTWDPETGWGRLGGGRLTPTADDARAQGDPVRSPDGRLAVHVLEDRVRLEAKGVRDLAAALGEATDGIPIDPRSFQPCRAVFSPDSRFLALADSLSCYGVFDVRSGGLDRCVIAPTRGGWPVAFSPEGGSFAARRPRHGGKALIWRLPR